MNFSSKYLKDARLNPPLSEKEEHKLLKKMECGSIVAREQIVKANIRLVLRIANDYVNLGVPLDDLIEVGVVNLKRSVDRFDLQSGIRFSTYCTWWIKQGISKVIVEQGKDEISSECINSDVFSIRHKQLNAFNRMRRFSE